jgi:tetratricopeptide (TPR) repeat protein
LLPVFFLPFLNISVEASKGLFFAVGLIAAVIFWIILRFSDGKIELPRSLPLLGGAGIVGVTLLSAIFGGAAGASFFGIMFDVGSFWFIFAAFLLMLMSSMVFREPKNARVLLFGTILSSTVLLVFQGVHLFLPKILSFGILVNKTDNILGSWNAFGIFAGFFVVCSLFAIEFFPATKRIKMLLGILALFAALLIAAVNFVLVWEILGIFALFIFVYKLSLNSGSAEAKAEIHFPIFSFAIVLISLFFFMSSSFLGGILPTKLGMVNNEISPSFLSTMSITKSVIRHNPILGIGPNRFADAWALYKPPLINTTQFWDVSFNAGSGLIPTLTATTGVLGVLAWVIFLGLLLFTGAKWLFFSIKNNASLETVSFFFLSLYLFTASFFYYTSTVIFLLAFVFTGVFIGLISSSRKNGEISISVFNDHRKSFFFMLFLVILMIVSAGIGFKFIQRFVSVPYFTSTLSATNITEAETSINKALSLNSNDLYLRTYSQIYLLKLNSIASKEAAALSDSDKANLQASLDQSIQSAQLATVYDPKNYLNFQMLGSVFQTAGLVGVKEGYSKALEAYQKASELNPGNPRLKLAMTNVSIALGDGKAAKEYANQALNLKSDYVDALITLSQIAKSEGDTSTALSYAERALALSPGNKDLITYINSLRNGSSPNPNSQTSDTPATDIKKQ